MMPKRFYNLKQSEDFTKLLPEEEEKKFLSLCNREGFTFLTFYLDKFHLARIGIGIKY